MSALKRGLLKMSNANTENNIGAFEKAVDNLIECRRKLIEALSEAGRREMAAWMIEQENKAQLREKK